ncbi:MAG: potassium channel family protein [Pseudomonadota bacterium]
MSPLLVILHWVLPFLAAAGTVLIHHAGIGLVYSKVLRTRGLETAAPNMVQALLVLLAAHLFEIALFAVGFVLLQAFATEPVLTGAIDYSFPDYIYYSATTYTSLGLGDVYPAKPARLLTGVEALTGLIMIAWTAAFLFAETERSDGD